MTNLKGMFGLLDVPFSNTETIYYLKSYLIVLLLAALGATPITKAVINKLQSTAGSRRIFNLLLPVVHVSLLLLITGYLIDDSFNPFLYFRF